MAQCVVLDTTSGQLVTTADTVDTCTGWILATPTEFSMMESVFTGLTIDQGQTIGVAIFTAWAIVWGLRMIATLIRDADPGNDGGF